MTQLLAKPIHKAICNYFGKEIFSLKDCAENCKPILNIPKKFSGYSIFAVQYSDMTIMIRIYTNNPNFLNVVEIKTITW